jgi:hypothetical protein
LCVFTIAAFSPGFAQTISIASVGTCSDLSSKYCTTQHVHVNGSSRQNGKEPLHMMDGVSEKGDMLMLLTGVGTRLMVGTEAGRGKQGGGGGKGDWGSCAARSSRLHLDILGVLGRWRHSAPRRVHSLIGHHSVRNDKLALSTRGEPRACTRRSGHRSGAEAM